MNKKKLYKLIKKAVNDGNNQRYKLKDTPVTEERINDALFSESTEESKTKIRNLITRLSHHRDELDYNINETTINISSSYQENFKNNKPSSHFNIQIIKGVGFIINFNESRILMKDITLYVEMKEQIKKVSDQVNQDNFTELYSAIMKDNGLTRESNLDDILNGL